MLSSVNFKFSLFLAFLTWIILCYMEMIGKRDPVNDNDVNVEVYTEHTQEESTSQQNLNPKEKSNELDKYLSCMWVFVCICVISKLVEYIEHNITRQLLRQIYFISEAAVNEPISNRMQQRGGELLALPPPQVLLALPAPPPSTLSSEVVLAPPNVVLPPTLPHIALPMPPPPPRLQQMRQPPPRVPAEAETENTKQGLIDTVKRLEERCNKMQEFFDKLLDPASTAPEVRPSSSQSRSLDVVPVAEMQLRVKPKKIAKTSKKETLPPVHTPLSMSSAPVTPTLQNVYIINSHLHLAGDIYVNQHNVNMDKPFITMPQAQARARVAPKPAMPALRSKADSEFRQIWSKFIQQPNERSTIANVTRRNFLT